MRFVFLIVAMIGSILLLGAPSLADTPSPYPDHPTNAGFVNDFAHVLSTEQKDSLEQELRLLEHDTQVEFAVVTVTSLHGMEVEDYANGLARHWGIGKEGAHNGLLFLTSPSDHRQRIEVGSRLEGILTDADSKEIFLEHYHPHAVAKDIPGAVVETTQALEQLLRQRLTPEENSAILSHKTQHQLNWMPIIFCGVLISIFIIGVGVFIVRTRKDEDEEDAISIGDEVPRAQSPRMSDMATGAALGAAASASRPARSRAADDTPYVPPIYSPPPSPPDSGISFGGDSGGFSGGGASGQD